jgi:hypothetical protein
LAHALTPGDKLWSLNGARSARPDEIARAFRQQTREGRYLDHYFTRFSRWCPRMSMPPQSRYYRDPEYKRMESNAMSKNYKLMVMTNVVAGGEQEFNEWYDKIHLADVLKVPGYVAAQRFRMVAQLTPDMPYRYCAIYDVNSDDPKESVQALQTRAGTDEMPLSDKMDPRFYAALYEAVGEPLSRKPGR